MERSDDQMPGLRCRTGGADGFMIPHLADEYDIRILPECVFEGLGEGFGVAADLPLLHERCGILENIFDGILYSDNHAAALLADVLNHRSHGRALARAGDPCNQD